MDDERFWILNENDEWKIVDEEAGGSIGTVNTFAAANMIVLALNYAESKAWALA